MKLNVTFGDYSFSLEVSDELELENFKAFCEIETGIQANELKVFYNNTALNDNKKSMSAYGVGDGDIIRLEKESRKYFFISCLLSKKFIILSNPEPSSLANLDFSSIQVPSTSTSNTPKGGHEHAIMLREMLLANPDQLANLKQSNPLLADAVLSGSLDEFAKILKEQYAEKNKQEEQKLKLLTSNPFDYEAQRLIAEEIRQKNIEANMEAAIEYNPETFGTVIMLYIDCKVNGHAVKAFIDSGAQATIMSQGRDKIKYIHQFLNK